MKNEQAVEQFPVISFVKSILLGFIFLFAALSALTYTAQIAGVSFRVYAYFGLAVILFFGFFVARVVVRLASSLLSRQANVLHLIYLALICICCSAVILAITRSDGDDFYYVPNAVFYLLNPGENMGWDIHYLYGGTQPFQSVFWATATPYEYSQAIIAYFLGCEYLFVYYILTPTLVGTLIALAYFYALSRFTQNTGYALLGTAAILSVALILGETPRSPGIFFFTRAYQGKAFFLSAGIALYIGVSRDYFISPSKWGWLAILATSIALVGTTSTAVVVLPCFAAVLASAEYFLKRSPADYLSTAAAYLLSSTVYNATFALATLNHSRAYTGVDNIVNIRFPSTFIGQINLLKSPELPVTFILAVLITTATLGALPIQQRKYLTAWIAVSFVFFLNPIVSGFLIKYVFTSNIYWRLFYILPFPISVGLLVVSLLTRSELDLDGKNGRIFTAGLFVILLVVNLLFGASSVFNPNNGSTIAWADYKIQRHLVESARQIIKITPPGVMLAPTELSGAIVMLSGAHPQIRVRSDAERLWLGRQGLLEDAELRIHASQFVAGDSSKIETFNALLLKYPSIRSIVMDRNIWKIKESVKLANQYGFLNSISIKRYVIIWK